MTVKLRPSKNSNAYQFGNGRQKYQKSINVRPLILENMVIRKRVDVLEENVLSLLALGLLDKYNLAADNVHEILVCHE